MTDDASKTPRRSWRNPAQPAARPARGVDHAWKKRGDPASAPRVARAPSKNARIVRNLLSLVGTLLVIGWVISWYLPSRPACLVLIGADYAQNLRVPHNVHGVSALRGLEELTRRTAGLGWFNPPPLRLVADKGAGSFAIDRASDWERVKAALDPKASKYHEDVIVVVMALHGVTDAKEAYLVPNTTTGPEDYLALAKIVKDLGALLPPEKQKVLILEGAQVPSARALGMLENDFAMHVRELDETIANVPNLWVLSGCDVGQRCWVSDGLKRGVFGHYLIEGLSGKASVDDQWVTLGELFDYVHKHVSSWVWETRRAIQEPVLLPRAAMREKTHRLPPETIKLAASSAVSSTPLSRVPTEASLREEWTRSEARLAKIWSRHVRLASVEPAPWVYTPRRWSDYRARLVRLDQLASAGAEEAANRLETDLEGLARRMMDERLLNLPETARNSLVTNAVRGGLVDLPASTDFSRLLSAETPKELEEVIASLQTAAGRERNDRSPQPLIAAADFLFKHAASNPRQNLDVAARQLLGLLDPDVPRPTETHFLLMLSRASKRLPQGALAKWPAAKALDIRRLAERAALGIGGAEIQSGHFYSAQILSWLRPVIVWGDEERRRAEDRLFTSEAPVWTDSAVPALTKAEEWYTRAVRRALTLRSALATRDRLFAELPGYSRWLAHRHARKLDDDRVASAESLWSSAHDLAAKLDDPGSEMLDAPDPDLTDALLEQIGQITSAIGPELDRLVLTLTTIDQGRDREDWEAVTAAAGVAFRETDESIPLRRAIWRRLGDIAINDLRVEQTDTDAKFAPSVEEREREKHETLARARIEARMALAAIGRGVFDRSDLQRKGLVGYDSLAERLATTSSDPSGPWRAVIADIGTNVGSRVRRLPAAIDELTSEAGGTLEPAVLRTRLREAARIGRLIDGSVAAIADSAREAGSRDRDARVFDLLLWLAERAWLDHWHDLDPNNPMPYYKAVGARFIDQAAKLVAKDELLRRLARIDAVKARERFDEPGELAFSKTERLTLTSERAVDVTLNVVRKGKVPPGDPVVSAVSANRRVLELDETLEGQSIFVPLDKTNRVSLLVKNPLEPLSEIDGDPSPLRVERSSLAVSGFFRGHQFRIEQPVESFPAPTSTVISPLIDGRASIAVRADKDVIERFGEGKGAIAIVLDCSASMGPDPLPRATYYARLDDPVKRTKFTEARQALVSVLGKVPAGTQVSLWTFSQEKRGGARMLNEFNAAVQARASHPEQTIERIFGPSAWDPKMIDSLIRKLNDLDPFHGTPLVAAIARAKDDLRDARGFRSLVVLTDGDDDQFAKNTDPTARKAAIEEKIRSEFQNSGVMVNMICFKLQIAELERARRNFEDVLTRQLEPPGSFVQADDGEMLIDKLRMSLRQTLVCQVKREDGVLVDSLEVAPPAQPPNDRWLEEGLEPGVYWLQVRTDRVQGKRVRLERGQKLIVGLVVRPDGTLDFQRVPLSDDYPKSKPFFQSSRGWRTAVFQKRQEPASVDMLTIVEPISDVRKDYLLQARPSWTWFELVPPEGTSPAKTSVRWRELSTYAAPVWRIEAAGWPDDPGGQGPAVATLQNWWGIEPVAPVASIDLPSGFATPRRVQPLPVSVGRDDTVIVESLRLEEHAVSNSSGLRRKLPCLVVRLRYPTGKPHWVTLDGLEGINEKECEHRFYIEADRYTGIFWSVGEDEVTKKLRTLRVYSLENFKDAARSNHRFVSAKLWKP